MMSAVVPAQLTNRAKAYRSTGPFNIPRDGSNDSLDRQRLFPDLCARFDIRSRHKFTRYWDVEHREIPMEHERLLMTPEEVLKRCDENTIGVVPTLGVTFTCDYEPVNAVADALDKLQRDKVNLRPFDETEVDTLFVQ